MKKRGGLKCSEDGRRRKKYTKRRFLRGLSKRKRKAHYAPDLAMRSLAGMKLLE